MAPIERQEEIHNISETQNEVEERRTALYEAAKEGDWRKATIIFENIPEAIKERLNPEGETPLHVAIAAMQNEFVENLLCRMGEEDMEIRTGSGKAAIHYAVENGNLRSVQLLKQKYDRIDEIRDNDGKLPICIAALNGRKEIVDFLPRKKMNDNDRFDLLINWNEIRLYDFLTDLIYKSSTSLLKRVGERDQYVTLLTLLSKLGPRIDFDKLKEFPWDEIKNLALASNSDAGQAMDEILSIAVEEGKGQFLENLARIIPGAFLKNLKNDHTIFHLAVMSRFKNIFKLIQGMDVYTLREIKDKIGNCLDANNNNVLHLAGYLPSSSTPKRENGNRFNGYSPSLNRLNDIPGAALQLLSELVWFEGVQKFVHPKLVDAKNKDKLTPRDVFFKEHENLRKAGEEWMRNTANSCMVVATLIATVVFAAAFTVPGGNKQDSGIPIFLEQTAFKAFVISDGLSLVCSISTVLSFLSILTSQYSVDDFRYWLPMKLLMGLLFLSVSVIAMMVAFVAAFFIVVKHGHLNFAYAIAAIASIPIVLFICQHALLFYQIIHWTFFAASAFKIKKKKCPIWC